MKTLDATFRVGDLVEVKTPDEILDTLDADGTLDQLPFMPEMVEFCGKRFAVSRRVANLCISGPHVYGTMLSFKTDDVVLLDGLRCGGTAHDACQRACMIFWREAWLRNVTPGAPAPPVTSVARDRLRRRLKTSTGPTTYFCQASELFKVTNKLSRRDQVSRCAQDVRTGRTSALSTARRLGIWLFWRIRRKLLGEYARGRGTSTPTAALGLEAGDWVEVKSRTDIAGTLDAAGHNRGLYFSPDLRLAIGKRHRVSGRLDRIIADGTGEMRHMRNTVALEGSLCSCAYINVGECSRRDLVYWREIWLRPVTPAPPGAATRRGAAEDASVVRGAVT